MNRHEKRKAATLRRLELKRQGKTVPRALIAAWRPKDGGFCIQMPVGHKLLGALTQDSSNYIASFLKMGLADRKAHLDNVVPQQLAAVVDLVRGDQSKDDMRKIIQYGVLNLQLLEHLGLLPKGEGCFLK